MSWEGTFVELADLAHVGEEVATALVAVIQHVQSPHNSLYRVRAQNAGDVGGRADAWLSAATQAPIEDDHIRQQVALQIEAARTALHDIPNDSVSPIQTVVAMLRAEAHRLVRNQDDLAKRWALLALLARHRSRASTAETDETSLAEAFGCDSNEVREWADWLEGQRYVRVNDGLTTLLRGHCMKIRSEGIDALAERARMVAEADVAPPSLATLPAAPVMVSLDVSFMHDARVREVVERDLRELKAAVAADLHTAAIVLAGAAGEGVLYDALLFRKPKAMAAAKAPKQNKNGPAKDIEKEEWSFFNYIEVAAELGVIDPTTETQIGAHKVLRGFRNMIHPKVQVDENLRPDAPEMQSSVAWLASVVRDVKKAPP